ncbi:MAG: lysylphosphatidylglycerol synthase transmembrane domain-containing protein [Ferruginibacter sp.]
MNKNIKIFLNYFLGPLLFIALSWSLYKQIINRPDLPERWEQIKLSWKNGYFWIAFFLVFLNWGLEARKWQLLIAPLEKFTFIKAFKSVLSGCSVTMLTPNRIGEYGGRIVYVQEEHRLSAIPLTILGSISQLSVTVIVGTLGLLFFRFGNGNPALFDLMPAIAADILIGACVIASISLVLIYLRVGLIIKMVSKIKRLHKLNRYLELLSSFSRKQLLRILFLSFLRYMVFILQYVLLLKVMQVDIANVLCFWLLSVFYLLMAIAPTIGFTELPVRAAVSVQVLQLYSSNIIGIQAASLVIWIINLVIPAIAGSLLIFGIKIMKEK